MHRIRLGLIVAVIAIAAVAVRVVIESANAYSRGEAATAAGEVDAAVFHYRSAVRWYAPFIPWPSRAIDRLMEIASQAEDDCEACSRSACNEHPEADCSAPACGDCLLALHTYDSLRAGIVGSRSLYQPFSDTLAKVDERLPSVMVRAREVHPNGPRSSPQQRPALLARFEERIAVDHAPDPLWSLLSSLGFLLWVIGLVLALWKGWPGPTERDPRAFAQWSIASAVGFAVWIAALAAL